MSMFRSEDMEYCRLVLPRESAWETVDELGKIGCVHQVDSETHIPNISRTFYNQVKRCDEVDFMLQDVTKQIHKYKGQIVKCTNFENLVQATFPRVLAARGRAGRSYFDDLETEVKDRHANLIRQVANLDNINENLKNLEEYRQVLVNSLAILGPSFFGISVQSNMQGASADLDIHGSNLEEIRMNTSSNLNKLCGIINSEDTERFQKVVFRITKGNCWVQVRAIPGLAWQEQENPILRSVFVLVFPGSNTGAIFAKIHRVCESFGANRYQFPNSQSEYSQKIQDIQQSVTESRQIIGLTRKNITDLLQEFVADKHNVGFSYIEFLKHYISKERSIYQSMNTFRISGSVLVGYAWIPKEYVPKAESALQQLGMKYANLPSSTLKILPMGGQNPPTFFKLNEFKTVFQLIVDTYGVPRYKEVNPGLFTIVTFPFLFGVMFGDIGHGGLLFIFGLYLLIFKDKILADKTSMLRGVVPARYLVVLMGFFALYAGMVYNDFLSLNLNFFGSCYNIPPHSKTGGYATPKPDCVYPFGLDPAWGIADNGLTNANSFKMKLAVIFAVLQMCMGITMKAFNSVYFKKWVDFFFEFLPQILFMGLMFGYMDFLIILKWATNFRDQNGNLVPTIPAIITTLIDLALKMGGVSDANGPLVKDADFQSSIQGVILAIALICVPVMLFPKPLILNYQNKRKNSAHMLTDNETSQRLLLNGTNGDDDLARDLEKVNHLSLDNDASSINGQKHGAGHDSHDDFGEIFVHQIIETIEFVLGSISNTASYLRLWALSLAHSQLAEVFFSKGIQSGLEDGSVPMLVVGYFVFAMVTCAVLLAMDVMECFLHALRLHWVEFQNKFYKADGYAFTPLNFVSQIQASMPSEEEELAQNQPAKK